MGLIEFVVASLCLNATCEPEDAVVPGVSTHLLKLNELAEELKEETLTVTTFENGQLSGYISQNGSFLGTGVAFDIFHILQEKFGFNYTIVLPDADIFMDGFNKKGAKSLLEAKQADIAVSFLPVIESFRNDVVYSRVFDIAEWNVLMNRPKESATGSGLLAPFTTAVWILIIFSVLVVGPIMYLMILIRAKMCKDDNNKIFSLPSCMWFVYGALLKQGSTLNPKSDSSRILFSTWWLFILILTAFYTANLTAFLTLSKFTLPITDPTDISRKNYHWVTNKANGLRDYIEYEKHDRLSNGRTLVQDIGKDRYYADMKDLDILEEYVKKRNMMFIREKTLIKNVMYRDYQEKTKRGVDEEKRCTFVMADFPITMFSRGFAYTHDFKYAELFDRTFQYLIEAGIIQFKLRENLPDAEICPLNLGSIERKLRNTDLMLTYVIVASGLGIAASVFLLEILWRMSKAKYKRTRKRKATTWLEKNNNLMKAKCLHLHTNSSPPPPYQALFRPPFYYSDRDGGQKKTINGRDYWVIDKSDGLREIIPIRTPSALLFQISN
uniref:Ionotropic receptor IR5 n=1 Tax=Colaphellus bowringi TaxID=561076 RepID=A0A0S3J2L2_9CUCU|nr:ionotropic receptor IR5 [Colaphellus bowringi]